LKPPRTTDANLVLDESGCAVASVTKRYARTVSGIAFTLMAVDFIDRQLVVAAFTYLKAEWRLSSRVKAIAVMGTTWSLATLAGGFAHTSQLFVARAVVGLDFSWAWQARA
jgi:hypothetical protein